ncbi:glycosyltransferase family 2 protein [Candidatus Roizmanbacteria bacterium]|nr:glycosyltransferase family 2 protein [Candidatus Roizmanbacteria bacterium]
MATLYNSADYIPEFYRRVTQAVARVTSDYEVILVDDGSPDNSLSIARNLLKDKHPLKIVALSRNFGHHKAVMKGLSCAKGEFIFLIDCDLEEPPELFQDLYKKMRSADKKDPVDIVQAVQNRRKGPLFEKISGYLFYKFFNILSDSNVPENSMMARLMTRRFVKALLLHEEREFFLSGLCSLTGFKLETLAADKTSKGKTSYSLSRKILSAINAVTAFSDRPLFFIFYFGIFLSFFSFGGIFYLFLRVIFFGTRFMVGWFSIVLLISFLGGFGIASIGVVGLYLGRIFIEVKKRPLIVKGIYSNH